jgi:hypothetical protein
VLKLVFVNPKRLGERPKGFKASGGKVLREVLSKAVESVLTPLLGTCERFGVLLWGFKASGGKVDESLGTAFCKPQ